jgi:glucokinase
VSYERVLAGNGFSNLLAFLRETGRAPVPAWLDAEIDRGHPNSVITRAGLDGRAEICVRVLELWADILGAEAGNLALRSAATDGVIVGGGIPPKVLPALERPAFVTAFRQKGRMTDWLSRRLVKVALEPRAPLIGAAHYLQDSGGLR